MLEEVGLADGAMPSIFAKILRHRASGMVSVMSTVSRIHPSTTFRVVQNASPRRSFFVELGSFREVSASAASLGRKTASMA